MFVFLLVVTSRRDELTSLRGDLYDRMSGNDRSAQAATQAWEAIQRIELLQDAPGSLRHCE